MKNQKNRLVIGMSGASGVDIGIELLKSMQKAPDIETHLVISESARQTIEIETNYSFDKILTMATNSYDIKNIGAAIASGTFKTIGMVVVPCSMKTLAGIANGFSDNLLLRAADVALKERRKLILVTRELPFSSIHLQNMLTLSLMGATIMPPVMTFYNKPKAIKDMTMHIVGKIADALGVECENFKRWS